MTLAVNTVGYRNATAGTPELHGSGLRYIDSLLVMHCCHSQAHTLQDGNPAGTGGKTQTATHHVGCGETPRRR
jgi:hypothetical protein